MLCFAIAFAMWVNMQLNGNTQSNNYQHYISPWQSKHQNAYHHHASNNFHFNYRQQQRQQQAS